MCSKLLLSVFLLITGVSCELEKPFDDDKTMNVLVLDSLGGSPVEGVKVQLFEAGTSLVKQVGFTNASGKFDIIIPLLDKSGKYDIVAEKKDLASCKIQDFTYKEDFTPIMYCHDLMMISYRAIAPTITKVEYSNDESTWFDLGSTINSADLQYLKVSVIGKSEIKETDWCGYGVKIAVNQDITHWDGLTPASFDKEGVGIGNTGDYETVAVYDLSSFDYMTGNYSLYINAFDVAANRVEKTIDIFVDSSTSGSDPTLASVKPVIVSFVSMTYSVSKDYFGSINNLRSVQNLPDGAVHYNGHGTTFKISFDVRVPAGVRRIDIYRSEDGVNYKKLDKNISLTNITATEAAHTFSDADGTIDVSKKYHYKVVAVNGSGVPSMESDSISLKILPPHNTILKAPINKSISGSVAPNFVFLVDNRDLLNEEIAEYFNFQLQIRNKLNPLYNIPMKWDRVNNVVDVFGYSIPEAEILEENITTGLITIKFAFFADNFGYTFEQGKSYEWNIIDESQGSFFSNSYSNADGTFLGEEQSFSSNSANGQGALNGWFTLTIADDAK